MDDEDFAVAFELFDRPKGHSIVSKPGLPPSFYSIPPPQPVVPQSYQNSSAINKNSAQDGNRSGPSPTGGNKFRRDFLPPQNTSILRTSAPKPLDIVHNSSNSSFSGNRHFILPSNSTHTRTAKSPIISIQQPTDTSISSKRTPFYERSSFPEDIVEPTSEDELLAPIPGISSGLTPKRTGTHPIASPRAKMTSPRVSTPNRLALRHDNNHTITLEDTTDTALSAHVSDAALLALPPECDETEATTWRYPSNYEKREYQFEMVNSALFKNTLVCLPTGLGKTLIAAVVMYNFYRWFPNSKIIFMAPTKPLVNQQIEACRDICSLPPDDSIVLTGKTSPDTRAKHWTSKRIFFTTPHIPQNDIESGICPAEKVCLLVFDEAHKAHGDFSYCDVIRGVAKATPYFRVLALSATPGSDVNSIQDVLTNLLISKIELRTEESPDVKPYSHTRFVEEIPVKLEGPIVKAKDLLKQLINVPIVWLQSHDALYRTKKGDFFTFTRLEAARNDFRNNPNMQRKDEYFKSQVEARFATAMSMYYGSKLITDYGLGPFKVWLNEQTSKPLLEKTSQYFAELISSKEWYALYRFVNEEIGDPNSVRHPKLKRLESIVLDHFHSLEDATSGKAEDASSASNSRVMIFVSYRDTVEEIVAMLQPFSPLIRPMAFVGQSKKGLSQKQQAQVVQQFRSGHYNTLVSTSVGEEGLDIGEVDLIVCYDSQQSPIRMVQRMGRTGRKRNGRCVMLLTIGTEDVSYKRSKVKSKTMVKAICGNSRFHFFNGHQSSHLLPAYIQPKPIMWYMEKPVTPPAVEIVSSTAKKSRAKRTSSTTTKHTAAATTTNVESRDTVSEMDQDEDNSTSEHAMAPYSRNEQGQFEDLEIEEGSEIENEYDKDKDSDRKQKEALSDSTAAASRKFDKVAEYSSVVPEAITSDNPDAVDKYGEFQENYDLVYSPPLRAFTPGTILERQFQPSEVLTNNGHQSPHEQFSHSSQTVFLTNQREQQQLTNGEYIANPSAARSVNLNTPSSRVASTPQIMPSSHYSPQESTITGEFKMSHPTSNTRAWFNQSQGGCMDESIHVPLDEFPDGFFESSMDNRSSGLCSSNRNGDASSSAGINTVEPNGHASVSNASYAVFPTTALVASSTYPASITLPPPPPDSVLPIDYALGFVPSHPLQSAQQVASPTQVKLPSGLLLPSLASAPSSSPKAVVTEGVLATNATPLSSPLVHRTSASQPTKEEAGGLTMKDVLQSVTGNSSNSDGNSHSMVNEHQLMNTLLFHTHESSEPGAQSLHVTVDAVSHAASSPNSSCSTSSTSSPAPASAPNSAISISLLSSDTPPLQSPRFKRLKRARDLEKAEDKESLIRQNDEAGEEEEKDMRPMNPPKAKRPCPKPLRPRYLDEEASQDDNNSDAGSASEDESESEVLNSQDIAFIAAEDECDQSVMKSKMRSVYARSLCSPWAGNGESELKWFNGQDLASKMRDWAEYSDMEARSDSTGASMYDSLYGESPSVKSPKQKHMMMNRLDFSSSPETSPIKTSQETSKPKQEPEATNIIRPFTSRITSAVNTNTATTNNTFVSIPVCTPTITKTTYKTALNRPTSPAPVKLGFGQLQSQQQQTLQLHQYQQQLASPWLLNQAPASASSPPSSHTPSNHFPSSPSFVIHQNDLDNDLEGVSDEALWSIDVDNLRTR